MTNSRDLLPVGGFTGTAWTLDNPSIPPYGKFYVGTQELTPEGVFFKPDGLKMYVIGSNGDAVYEYDLSTAWDVSTASYLQNFSVAAQETNPTGVFFKPDGLKMYVVGYNGDDVNEYNLSTAWDVSTASYVQNFYIGGQDTVPQGVFFKPDGLKMYVVGSSGGYVYEYDLSTAWNISTASFSRSMYVAPQDVSPTGVFFKPDGLKTYVSGASGDAVYEYDLSIAWNTASNSYLQSFSVVAQDTAPLGLFFKPDGLKMYVIGSTGDAVYEYDLSTAWDVSTAAWIAPANSYFSVAAQETSPHSVFFKPDGLKMYVIGSSGDDVNEYNLSTAWDVSTASFLQSFSVAAQDIAPRGVFFKSDGLKMYVSGVVGDAVYEYNLSTAWDVSTASFLQSFSIAAQDTVPHGIFFRADGLKMYFIGLSGDAVYEYDLSTAWDVSTTSFVQSFSTVAQDTTPLGVFFKPDGFKMYITGNSGPAAYEYNLSIAWDVSTASYVQSFNTVVQDKNPQGVFFKPDGKVMYIIGSTGRAVWAYSLT